VLCTRAQLSEREFEAWQGARDLNQTFTLKDALVFCLAASQGSIEAAETWNRAKRIMKRPPGCAKAVENLFHDLYLWAYRKGRAWVQAPLYVHDDLATPIEYLKG